MITFETDPDLTDGEMGEALRAVTDYLKQRPDIRSAQIKMNRTFAGADGASPTESYSRMRVGREVGGRWTISQRTEPLRRGLASLLGGN